MSGQDFERGFVAGWRARGDEIIQNEMEPPKSAAHEPKSYARVTVYDPAKYDMYGKPLKQRVICNNCGHEHLGSVCPWLANQQQAMGSQP